MEYGAQKDFIEVNLKQFPLKLTGLESGHYFGKS